MENTLENKAKFLGSHLGCEIEYPQIENEKKTQRATLVSVGYDEIVTAYKRRKKGASGDILSWKDNGSHKTDAINAKLLLTPLSAITDEDLDFLGWDISEIKDIEKEAYISGYETDYLRSKSYLLPYNGLSPEELIARGWAKLKTD